MLSPHKVGWGAYEDPFPDRTIYEPEERVITMGYKFLGWQVTADKIPEYKHCVNEGHNYTSYFPNGVKSVQHTPSGSDCTFWCPICKIYWKIDMSG